MIARILSTPIQQPGAEIPTAKPRRVDRAVLAAVLPGPARDRLAAGGVVAVTTGAQTRLFTGAPYTGYKALSAVAVAQRVGGERGGAGGPGVVVGGGGAE